MTYQQGDRIIGFSIDSEGLRIEILLGTVIKEYDDNMVLINTSLGERIFHKLYTQPANDRSLIVRSYKPEGFLGIEISG